MGTDNDAAVKVRPRPPRKIAVEPVPVRTVEQGKVSVSRTSYGIEHHEEETIDVVLFHTVPAKVSVSGGVTRNLGGMEFARIDVRVELPCYPEISEIERVTQIASDFVARKIAEQDAHLDPVDAPQGIQSAFMRE